MGTPAMASVTYYVVVAFDRNKAGELESGEPEERLSPDGAIGRAAVIARLHAGVVAFSRTGDASTGEFEHPVILMQVGEVNLDALSE